MKRKLAVILPIIMSLTACTNSSPETGEDAVEAITEALSETTAVSEVLSETEITSQTTEYQTTEHSESETEITSLTTEYQTTEHSESETEITFQTTEYQTTENTETEAETSSDSEWQSLYLEKLSEIREDEYFDPLNSSYDLFDVDSDGIPELFVAFGSFHAAGAEIYTVKDGECIKLKATEENGDVYECFGSWGTAEVAEGGYIISNYCGMGSDYNKYFKLENGVLSFIVSTAANEIPTDSENEIMYQYFINENEVSKEEYSSAAPELKGVKSEFVGQAYRFSDAEDAEQILSQWNEEN